MKFIIRNISIEDRTWLLLKAALSSYTVLIESIIYHFPPAQVPLIEVLPSWQILIHQIDLPMGMLPIIIPQSPFLVCSFKSALFSLWHVALLLNGLIWIVSERKTKKMISREAYDKSGELRREQKTFPRPLRILAGTEAALLTLWEYYLSRNVQIQFTKL